MEEMLDIYNDKMEHLGTLERKEVHKLGRWHKVVACLIINPNKEKVTAVFSANEYSLSDDLKHLLIEDNNDPTQFNVN